MMQELFGLGSIFGGQAKFGGQANQASQGTIQNLPAQLGQGTWITTSNGGTGISAQQQIMQAPQITSGAISALEKDVALIKYILQRTVPDYDEIVKQFNAIEDIKGAEQWDK
jgi:hypothetical protein